MESVVNSQVAPFAGAWIEITLTEFDDTDKIVAPFAGAWIEIQRISCAVFIQRVAPFAGAWIEIIYIIKQFYVTLRRTLRGCVD